MPEVWGRIEDVGCAGREGFQGSSAYAGGARGHQKGILSPQLGGPLLKRKSFRVLGLRRRIYGLGFMV